jgi:molybdenum cofactor cytidylyltransferase
MMRVAAILLAAGKSTRMGRNKLLIKLCGKRLIDHILDALEAIQVSEIVVVLGHEPDRIITALKFRLEKLKIVINNEYEKGMFSSFKTGLRKISSADAILVLLGDQIILEPNFLNLMVGELENKKGNVLIVSPIYKGKKGHPLLFSKKLFAEILHMKETETIRDIVHRHKDSLLTIEAKKWTIKDIDTPEDLAKATKILYNK